MNVHISVWFPAWLDQHKVNNPHNAWAAFEAPGYARAYLGWIKAFDEMGATEADADAASLRLQQQGEVWPVDHLARLLAILSPMIAARKADAEMARRRRESAEWAIEQDARRIARDTFRALPADEIEGRLASIRRRYLSLRSVSSFVEWFAVDEWRGLTLPAPPPGDEIPGPVEDLSRAAPAGAAEPPLTPGQVEFLGSLDEGQLAAVASMTPRRRGQILAPHAGGFDPSLMPVLIAELGPVAPAEPATA